MKNADILKANYPGVVPDPDVACVVKYIKRVWNEKRLIELPAYLDDQYIDHSMPHALVQNQQGLTLYLDQLAKMVSHTTDIIELTTLGELVICHVKISVTDPSGDDSHCPVTEVFFGYRMFRMMGGKISEHWEIL